MADDAKDKARNAEPESDGQQTKKPGRTAFWRRFLTQKWTVTLVAVSVVVHGFGFLYYQFAGRSRQTSPNPEVNLGAFEFKADRAEFGAITKAEFSLYIALLEQVDREARGRLENHKFRVQQDVEELLRDAHGGDFDDPKLGQLKRQLQEQVNETLGMRAIADVIITDLKVQRSNEEVRPAPDVAEAVPWVEKPSS